MTNDQAIKILEGAIKKPNTIDGYLGQALTMAINALKNQPEIIRCKNCIYHNIESKTVMPWCSLLRANTRYNAFCSYAERKGEEEC